MHLTDEQLNEYLDDVIHDRAQIEEHLASCAECGAQLAALKVLFTELESLPEQPLSHDLATAVTRTLSRSGTISSATPRWFTLTIRLQAALAVIAVVIAAPFVIDFASTSMPVLQAPSFSELTFQTQSQWVAWLDMLSQLRMPSMPELPLTLNMSGLYLVFALTGSAVVWLVGNGLLLRNQIK